MKRQKDRNTKKQIDEKTEQWKDKKMKDDEQDSS